MARMGADLRVVGWDLGGADFGRYRGIKRAGVGGGFEPVGGAICRNKMEWDCAGARLEYLGSARGFMAWGSGRVLGINALDARGKAGSFGNVPRGCST